MADTAKIYLEYKDRVFGYLLHRLNNRATAEDLCSEVFFKVISKIDSFDETKSSLSTWIYNITRNTLYDRYRTHHETGELSPTLASDDDFVEKICDDETLDSLADALEALPDREKRIIIFHYYNGMNLKDIAAKLDISYSYTKLLHSSALEKLKKNLDNY